MNKELIHKFIKVVINKVLESYDDIDIEVFEVSGLFDLEKASQKAADNFMEILTSEQCKDLMVDTLILTDLCIEHKQSRETFNEIKREAVQAEINKHIIQAYGKLVEIAGVSNGN